MLTCITNKNGEPLAGQKKPQKNSREATTDACRVCTPLGATVAFRGVENTIPLLHGSQGCSTYIRRYLIGHFREPVDVASSNFHEEAAIFGGRDNLRLAIQNVVRQYQPSLIGVATTCLSETIGDDVRHYLRELEMENVEGLPPMVNVSTPSYQGSHHDGFVATLRALVEGLSGKVEAGNTEPAARAGRPRLNLLSAMLSPADLRHFQDLASDYGVEQTLLPDYSDTLDGAIWDEYQRIPQGGTKLSAISAMNQADLSLEIGRLAPASRTAGGWLAGQGVPLKRLDVPLGIRACDALHFQLSELSGREVPERHQRARGRLVDSYVDAHKYVFGKRVVVYADPDLLVGLCAFLSEIGMRPIAAATGAPAPALAEQLRALPHFDEHCQILPDADFDVLTKLVQDERPDLLVGSGKGFKMAHRSGIPLVRVGFPIHDRFGGGRIQHVGYDGTQQLFDVLVNALLSARQARSSVGWTYF